MRALIEFIGRYEPTYAHIVRGIPEDKVAELEAALGRHVPGVYREFLLTMGQVPGFDTPELDFDIDEVISMVTDRGEPLPKRYVPIARDEGPTFEDYFLDLLHPADEEDAMVVRISAGDRIAEITPRPVFSSLRDMLFCRAFERVRMLTLPEKITVLCNFDMRSRGLDIVNDLMVRLGFAPLEVTSPGARLYERQDAAAFIYQVPLKSHFAIALNASDRRSLRRTEEALRDALSNRVEIPPDDEC